ncbi:MAG: hypothetical protein ACXW08_04775, partial [Solirubrobacteraceae bacterium]
QPLGRILLATGDEQPHHRMVTVYLLGGGEVAIRRLTRIGSVIGLRTSRCVDERRSTVVGIGAIRLAEERLLSLGEPPGLREDPPGRVPERSRLLAGPHRGRPDDLGKASSASRIEDLAQPGGGGTVLGDELMEKTALGLIEAAGEQDDARRRRRERPLEAQQRVVEILLGGERLDSGQQRTCAALRGVELVFLRCDEVVRDRFDDAVNRRVYRDWQRLKPGQELGRTDPQRLEVDDVALAQ